MSAIAPVALETLATERFSDGVEHKDTDDALPSDGTAQSLLFMRPGPDKEGDP